MATVSLEDYTRLVDAYEKLRRNIIDQAQRGKCVPQYLSFAWHDACAARGECECRLNGYTTFGAFDLSVRFVNDVLGCLLRAESDMVETLIEASSVTRNALQRLMTTTDATTMVEGDSSSMETATLRTSADANTMVETDRPSQSAVSFASAADADDASFEQLMVPCGEEEDDKGGETERERTPDERIEEYGDALLTMSEQDRATFHPAIGAFDSMIKLTAEKFGKLESILDDVMKQIESQQQALPDSVAQLTAGKFNETYAQLKAMSDRINLQERSLATHYDAQAANYEAHETKLESIVKWTSSSSDRKLTVLNDEMNETTARVDAHTKRVETQLSGAEDVMRSIAARMDLQETTLAESVDTLEAVCRTTARRMDEHERSAVLMGLDVAKLTTAALNDDRYERAPPPPTSYDGTFIWRIDSFAAKLAEAQRAAALDPHTSDGESFHSPPFYYKGVTGYKLRMRIFLNGNGKERGTHASLFFVVTRGSFDALLDWPLRCKVTMICLHHKSRYEDHVQTFESTPTLASYQRPTTEANQPTGLIPFIPLSKLASAGGGYVVNDTMFIKVMVTPPTIPSY